MLFRLLVQSEKAIASAPPFALTQQDVVKLFGDGFAIKQLSRENIFDSDPRWKSKGLTVCSMGWASWWYDALMNANVRKWMRTFVMDVFVIGQSDTTMSRVCVAYAVVSAACECFEDMQCFAACIDHEK